jgi:hypothetical protein
MSGGLFPAEDANIAGTEMGTLLLKDNKIG